MSLFILTHAFGFDSMRSECNPPILFCFILSHEFIRSCVFGEQVAVVDPGERHRRCDRPHVLRGARRVRQDDGPRAEAWRQGRRRDRDEQAGVRASVRDVPVHAGHRAAVYELAEGVRRGGAAPAPEAVRREGVGVVDLRDCAHRPG